MVTVIIGWYARKLYERWKKSKQPPPQEPLAVYQGEITMNQPSAGPLRSEQVLGEYNEKTGCREILEDGKPIPQSTKLTTWLTDEDGLDKISIRWEKRGGRFRLAKAMKGEVYRIEFHKVRDAERASPSTTTTHAQENTGPNPFGGGGVFN